MKKIIWLLAIVLVFNLCSCELNGRIKGMFDGESDGVQGGTPRMIELTLTGEIGAENIGNIGNMGYSVRAKHFSNCTKNDTLLPFGYNGRAGYCDESGRVIISGNYEFAQSFSNGYAVVGSPYDQHTALHIVNEQGSIVYDLPDNGFEGMCVFENDRLVFGNNDGDLCILTSDMRLSEVDLPTYYGSYPSSFINTPEFVGVIVYVDSQGFSLYDQNGDLLYNIDRKTLEESVRSAFGMSYGAYSYSKGYCNGSSGVLFVKNGYANMMNEAGRWGLIDLSSYSLALNFDYDYVGAYSDGVVPVCSYGKWGTVDISGNEVISCSYRYIGTFKNGRAFAIDQDYNYLIIDKSGNTVATFDLSNSSGCDVFVSEFSDKGIAMMVDQSGFRVITNTGEMLLYIQDDDDIAYYSENYIAANGKLYKFVLE